MQGVLGGGAASWTKYGPASGITWPSLQALLVFIGGNEAEMEEAADAAAACGYEHAAVLQGGLSDFAQQVDDQVRMMCSGRCSQQCLLPNNYLLFVEVLTWHYPSNDYLSA